MENAVVTSISQKYHYLQYVYHSRRLSGLIAELLRKVMAPIYQREAQYIFMRSVADQEPVGANRRAYDRTSFERLTLESPAALRHLEGELPPVACADLKQRFKDGNVVFLARRPGRAGIGSRVAGYCVCERGVFSALGRTRRISPDILFGHYTYVLPAYRGQRVFQHLRAAALEYCRSNGLKAVCGVVTTHNRASIQARLQTGERCVGTVERVAILGGLWVCETPWEQVEAALHAPGHQA